ncbi:hypothetical protein [Rhizobium sp. UGM030330-04]|uniref:hypothetical protein n=1 Tax=Rhizobium sp. UGM030330-04 TaxID=1378077 RepID=UPI000D9ECCB0|nr:hypothetical protein [Rhizobium sp. UGM030330-04]PYG53749.1 hypothetical protein N434_04819 [Rhizobium sp. UGM030330-04]
MSGAEETALHLSANGLMLQIEPSDRELREEYEALIREDYARCNPGDSLEWLKHRARFSKLDQGILYDWIGFAYKRIRQQD